MCHHIKHMLVLGEDRLYCECGDNNCAALDAVKHLTNNDSLNLGYAAGESMRIWTGGIDTVLGFDERGFVWVQDYDTGQIRQHLTARHIGRHDPVTICNKCGNSGSTPDFMETHTCATRKESA